MPNYSKAGVAILNQLAPWVREIKYNADASQWKVEFLPYRMIITNDFSNIVLELEKHVINEIIELVAEALDVTPKFICFKTRQQPNVDARIAVTIILSQQFNTIRDKTVAAVLGWRTHSSAVHARKQDGVKEIDQLTDRVYRMFPQLKNGKIEISQTINN